ELRDLMWDKVGPFRDATGLTAALGRIGEMRATLDDLAIAAGRVFNPTVADWFELRSSLLAAETVAVAALARRESRGAHQRDDFPDSDAAWAQPQFVAMNASGTFRLELVR